MGLVIVLLGAGTALSAVSLVSFARLYTGQRMPLWRADAHQLARMELPPAGRRLFVTGVVTYFAALGLLVAAVSRWAQDLSTGLLLLSTVAVLVGILWGPAVLLALVHNRGFPVDPATTDGTPSTGV